MDNYEQLEQEALRLYYDRMKMLGEGRLIPMTLDGKISNNEISYSLFSLAKDEVIYDTPVFGVDKEGNITGESLAEIEAMITTILEEAKLTPEERFASREARTDSVHNKESFVSYDYRLNDILKRYNLYTECCKDKGIEPREIYTYKQTESRSR